ncbi:hypothetical protein WG922_19350 [Ramlibacter sp. AN1015]|uniref:hypothetical protein n=1 Tax=Ramlibacter sp. AN1015 TaxID=3133428 RepID=UPI0030BE4A14
MAAMNDMVGQPTTPAAPDARLAEIIGASLAAPLARMRSLLQEVREARSWSESRLDALERAVEEALRVGVQSQQLARLAGGRLRQSHERLALHEIMLELLIERQPQFSAQKIEVRQRLKPVDIIVDGGLLLGLLEALLDWAVQVGRELLVKLEMKNWPEHGMLSLRAVRTPGTNADADNLAWELVKHSARLLGVDLKRESTDSYVQATLEFPRTVRQLSGLTALDADSRMGADSMRIDSQISGMAGMRALLVSDDQRLRREVAAICQDAGIKLELATRTQEAMVASELSQPTLIIIDGSLRDDVFDEYLERQLQEGGVRAVEVTDRDVGFEISAWEGPSVSRISRDSIKDQLKTVLSLEFGR